MSSQLRPRPPLTNEQALARFNEVRLQKNNLLNANEIEEYLHTIYDPYFENAEWIANALIDRNDRFDTTDADAFEMLFQYPNLRFETQPSSSSSSLYNDNDPRRCATMKRILTKILDQHGVHDIEFFRRLSEIVIHRKSGYKSVLSAFTPDIFDRLIGENYQYDQIQSIYESLMHYIEHYSGMKWTQITSKIRPFLDYLLQSTTTSDLLPQLFFDSSLFTDVTLQNRDMFEHMLLSNRFDNFSNLMFHNTRQVETHIRNVLIAVFQIHSQSICIQRFKRVMEAVTQVTRIGTGSILKYEISYNIWSLIMLMGQYRVEIVQLYINELYHAVGEPYAILDYVALNSILHQLNLFHLVFGIHLEDEKVPNTINETLESESIIMTEALLSNEDIRNTIAFVKDSNFNSCILRLACSTRSVKLVQMLLSRVQIVSGKNDRNHFFSIPFQKQFLRIQIEQTIKMEHALLQWTRSMIDRCLDKDTKIALKTHYVASDRKTITYLNGLRQIIETNVDPTSVPYSKFESSSLDIILPQFEIKTFARIFPATTSVSLDRSKPDPPSKKQRTEVVTQWKNTGISLCEITYHLLTEFPSVLVPDILLSMYHPFYKPVQEAKIRNKDGSYKPLFETFIHMLVEHVEIQMFRSNKTIEKQAEERRQWEQSRQDNEEINRFLMIPVTMEDTSSDEE